MRTICEYTRTTLKVISLTDATSNNRDKALTPTGELVAMATMLLTIPRLKDAEAHLCMPGLGEHWRVRQCIGAWDDATLKASLEGKRPPELLLSGAWSGEATYIEPTHTNLTGHEFGLPKRASTAHVHIQPVATNTPDQAQWLIDQFHELKVTTVNVHVAPYHMMRAYGTVLSQLIKAGMAEQASCCHAPASLRPRRSFPKQGLPTGTASAASSGD